MMNNNNAFKEAGLALWRRHREEPVFRLVPHQCRRAERKGPLRLAAGSDACPCVGTTDVFRCS